MLMMIYPQLFAIRAYLFAASPGRLGCDPGLELPAHTEATLPWCPRCLEDGSGGGESDTAAVGTQVCWDGMLPACQRDLTRIYLGPLTGLEERTTFAVHC